MPVGVLGPDITQHFSLQASVFELHGEVMVDGLIQVEFPLLHELHQPGGRDRLGDGSQGIERVFRGRDPLLPVRPPECLFLQNLTAMGHGDGKGRDP